jgi:hypothetical protein
MRFSLEIGYKIDKNIDFTKSKRCHSLDIWNDPFENETFVK